jgi:hypothetical protein
VVRDQQDAAVPGFIRRWRRRVTLRFAGLLQSDPSLCGVCAGCDRERSLRCRGSPPRRRIADVLTFRTKWRRDATAHRSRNRSATYTGVRGTTICPPGFAGFNPTCGCAPGSVVDRPRETPDCYQPVSAARARWLRDQVRAARRGGEACGPRRVRTDEYRWSPGACKA